MNIPGSIKIVGIIADSERQFFLTPLKVQRLHIHVQPLHFAFSENRKIDVIQPVPYNLPHLRHCNKAIMNPELYEFDSIEKRERKHWLLATICFLGIYPTLTFFVAILANDSSLDNSIRELLIIGSIALIFRLVQLGILVRSAYKKRGTTLLTLFLILGFINCVISVPRLLKTSEDAWVLADIIFAIGIYAWWSVASLKLLKINKKIETQKTTMS